jgi:beta-lactam-binding protein with PASTA domain
MKLKLIISFTFGVAIFVIAVFFISLKKNNTYDTKNLIGKSISNFNLYSLKHNVRITE